MLALAILRAWIEVLSLGADDPRPIGVSFLFLNFATVVTLFRQDIVQIHGLGGSGLVSVHWRLHTLPQDCEALYTRLLAGDIDDRWFTAGVLR